MYLFYSSAWIDYILVDVNDTAASFFLLCRVIPSRDLERCSSDGANNFCICMNDQCPFWNTFVVLQPEFWVFRLWVNANWIDTVNWWLPQCCFDKIWYKCSCKIMILSSKQYFNKHLTLKIISAVPVYNMQFGTDYLVMWEVFHIKS